MSSAIFSPCGRYRLRLDRVTGEVGPVVAIIGVNPSTADASKDDPTIRKDIGFATRLGWSRIIKANLCGYRATDVRELAAVADPVGPDTDLHLLQIMTEADVIVAAWGPAAKLPARLRRRYLEIVEAVDKPLYCFGTAKDGQPRHTLMLAYTTPLVLWTPPLRTVAALYVRAGGSYYGLPGVDPWDEARDARRYAGPHPVVAHPPCTRWGPFWAGQPLWIKRTGERKIKGDDGGCFASALAAIRKFGGVLEHPRGSHAWTHFNLAEPPRAGGWVRADDQGGWTCCVEQGRYGHYARKPTWLLAYGVDRPELLWGVSDTVLDPALVARLGREKAVKRGEVASRGGGVDARSRIETPAPFRDLLLSLARSVK